MTNQYILFDSPYKVKLIDEQTNISPKADQVLVKKHYSLISTGTELACLSGGEGWFNMPAVPGYCCVSEVCDTGDNCDLKIGEFIFHYGSHSLYEVINTNDFYIKIENTNNLKYIPMLRMATIAFTAVRVSDIELGDYVAVTGLGLVGNMAAQLAKLSGAFVIGIDPSKMRRDKANECGIKLTLDGSDNIEQIKQITNENGVGSIIEATGIPQVAYDLLPAAGYHGELILLGTPRGDYKANLADVLCYSHIDGRGSINFKGAHEWRYPVYKDQFVKHSIERNTQICLKLLEENQLKIDELITHTISPKQAPETYIGVHNNRDDYLGIIIDWSK